MKRNMKRKQPPKKPENEPKASKKQKPYKLPTFLQRRTADEVKTDRIIYDEYRKRLSKLYVSSKITRQKTDKGEYKYFLEFDKEEFYRKIKDRIVQWYTVPGKAKIDDFIVDKGDKVRLIKGPLATLFNRIRGFGDKIIDQTVGVVEQSSDVQSQESLGTSISTVSRRSSSLAELVGDPIEKQRTYKRKRGKRVDKIKTKLAEEQTREKPLEGPQRKKRRSILKPQGLRAESPYRVRFVNPITPETVQRTGQVTPILLEQLQNSAAQAYQVYVVLLAAANRLSEIQKRRQSVEKELADKKKEFNKLTQGVEDEKVKKTILRQEIKEHKKNNKTESRKLQQIKDKIEKNKLTPEERAQLAQMRQNFSPQSVTKTVAFSQTSTRVGKGNVQQQTMAATKAELLKLLQKLLGSYKQVNWDQIESTLLIISDVLQKLDINVANSLDAIDISCTVLSKLLLYYKEKNLETLSDIKEDSIRRELFSAKKCQNVADKWLALIDKYPNDNLSSLLYRFKAITDLRLGLAYKKLGQKEKPQQYILSTYSTLKKIDISRCTPQIKQIVYQQLESCIIKLFRFSADEVNLTLYYKIIVEVLTFNQIKVLKAFVSDNRGTPFFRLLDQLNLKQEQKTQIAELMKQVRPNNSNPPPLPDARTRDISDIDDGLIPKAKALMEKTQQGIVSHQTSIQQFETRLKELTKQLPEAKMRFFLARLKCQSLQLEKDSKKEEGSRLKTQQKVLKKQQKFIEDSRGFLELGQRLFGPPLQEVGDPSPADAVEGSSPPPRAID